MASDWRTVKVADLERERVLLVQDGNHGAYRPRPEEIVSDGIPHIRAADISGNGSIDLHGAQKVAESAWERIKKGRSGPGDALLTHKGTVGRVATVPAASGRVLCSPQTTLWRSLNDNVLDQRFIAAFLRSNLFQSQLRSIMHESDMAPYVSLTSQRALVVTIPPIEQQREISKVLAALDDKIGSNHRVADQTHEIVRASFKQKAKTRPVDVRLADAAEVTYGAPFSSKTFVDAGVGKPLLRIRDLKTRAPGVWTTEDRPDARLVVPGDIVVGMDAEFRAHCWSGPPSLLNQRVCVLDPRRDVARAYVLEAIKGPLAYQEATKQGTTVIHLGKRDIDGFLLPRFDEADMAEIRAVLDPLLELAVGMQREGDSLVDVRRQLLPKLVSGEIRVGVSNDSEEMIGAAIEAL